MEPDASVTRLIQLLRADDRTVRDMAASLIWHSSCPGWALEQMDASAPSPAESVVLSEALERRLASLADPELRQIALWRLEGFTNREIADRVDCVERSVERKLDRIRSKWTSYNDGSGP